MLTSPTSRFSDSNRNPSTAASNLHDVLASVALMNRRPVERPLVADREEARCSALGHAIGPGGVVHDAADIQWYTAPGKSDPSTTLDILLIVDISRVIEMLIVISLAWHEKSEVALPVVIAASISAKRDSLIQNWIGCVTVAPKRVP